MDAKTTYAQSSDIKSRTYLEYRRDMKKKAIVELELLDWLGNKAKVVFGDQSIRVTKGGGDKFIWFLRKGGVTREPDYEVSGLNHSYVELQYGNDIQKNSEFDFKVSKVTKKERGVNKRFPIPELLFLYLFKEKPSLYAFLDTEWISKKGKQTVAAAWGNSPVYRIPAKEMNKKIEGDSNLEKIWSIMKIKLNILNFQHQLVDTTKDNLSGLLQGVVDENKIVKLIPNDLDSFFKVCFILDNINKIPLNSNIWLVYLLSYINSKNTTEDTFKIVYCIDFLYSKSELKGNELKQIIMGLQGIKSNIDHFQGNDGSFKSSNKIAPIDEARFGLFSINLLEDLVQDINYYYDCNEIKPITKIFETVKNIVATSKFLNL